MLKNDAIKILMKDSQQAIRFNRHMLNLGVKNGFFADHNYVQKKESEMFIQKNARK